MQMDTLALPARILLWAVPVLFAVTVHEVAHGIVAACFGDSTARRAGRLSLNPLRHVDPVGSIVVPAILLWIGGFAFGWARPVPVDANSLRRPRRDMALVAVAGPLSNLFMSLAWALVMKAGIWMSVSGFWVGALMLYMGAAGVFINSALMMLNLLPLLPLDGGRILQTLLSERAGRLLLRLEPWGFPVLVLMIASGLLGKLVWPMMVVGMAASTHLAGLPVGLLSDVLGSMLG